MKLNLKLLCRTVCVLAVMAIIAMPVFSASFGKKQSSSKNAAKKSSARFEKTAKAPKGRSWS